MSQLTVTSSPHIRHPDSVPRIMWSVALALTPALVASGSFFGWRAFYVTGLSVLTALICEAAVQRLRKVPITVGDGSAVVTGILVAFCMPVTVPWFVPVVGSATAILIAKHCFGGLGNNIWNPALVGRAVVHWCYATEMNPSKPIHYPMVRLSEPGEGFGGHMLDFFRRMTVDVCARGADGGPAIDVVTGASPMAAMKQVATGQEGLDALTTNLPREFDSGAFGTMPGDTSLADAFFGFIGGNIGEVCALLLLLGAVYLIVNGYVRWYVPTLYIGTVAALVAVLPISVASSDGGETSLVWAAAWQNGALWQFVGYHVLCGGLMLGALYMATDMVTSPLTGRGQVIFAVGCGVLTVLIRLYGGYPEGVCYSILLMNTTVPLIDRWTRPRVFGTVPKKKVA